MRMRIVVAVAAFGLTILSGLPGQAAEKEAKGFVAVRQFTMDANGDLASSIKAILTEEPSLIAEVAIQAQAIADTAKNLPAMFPKDADNSHSYALKSVWEKPDEFAAASKKLEELASKLAETAKTGDVKASLAAFADMGRNGCGACHNEFRQKM